MGFFDRILERRNPNQLTEKSDTEKMHRYGPVTINGEVVEGYDGQNPESTEFPMVILRAGNSRESQIFQAEKVSFDNRQIDQVRIASTLPERTKDGQLSIDIPLIHRIPEHQRIEGMRATGSYDAPLVQKKGESPDFAVEIDRKNGKLLSLDVGEGLEIEWRDRSGSRHIFSGKKDQQGNPLFEAYEKNREGQWEWQTVAIPLNELLITYADQMIIRQKTDENTVREISARLYFGTEGSGITLSQQQISAEQAAAREATTTSLKEQELRQAEKEVIETWLNGLRGDHDIFINLLKKRGIQEFPKLKPSSPEDLDGSFRTGINDARKLFAQDETDRAKLQQLLDQSLVSEAPITRQQLEWREETQKLLDRPSLRQRLIITLQEVEWAGTPAVYTGEEENNLPERYFEVFLEERPDYHLFSWALQGMIKQGESNSQSFAWNSVPFMFEDKKDYEAWKKSYYKHKDQLKALAKDLGVEVGLADHELMLLALTLRLGTYLKNPYQKGTE